MSGLDPSFDSVNRHERPFLFPWVSARLIRTYICTNHVQNRRLRHLHGVSLRNLDLTTSFARQRGKTITDDDAPYNLESPTKRALRSDARKLTHASSFSDLVEAKKSGSSLLQKASTSYGDDSKRPSARPVGRMRRRSTLHWNSTTPRARQEKLRDLTSHRLIDTWFSLHTQDSMDPTYISEVAEMCMNPDFAFFDLDSSGPGISRSDDCTLRVWAKATRGTEYVVLVEIHVNLQSLQFVGKSLDSFHHPLPENCVLFHLSDGIYTSFIDLASKTHNHELHWETRAASRESASSFDALMQLANLDDCIQDALKIRMRLEQDVNELLQGREAHRDREQTLTSKKDRVAAAHAATEALRKQNAQVQKRIDELRHNLKNRKAAVRNLTQPSDVRNDELTRVQHSIDNIKASNQALSDSCHGQMRRVGEALLTIFPLEAITNRALQFTIRDVHLPNSVFDDTNRDEISAALGFTAQLIQHLSLYLVCSLPYPLEANSSQSWIRDPISAGLTQRRYPLHPTTVAYKFEYGVFLLNKDIEVLMSTAGLRVLDIRHTLPNLKYLLYVLTAGSGDLPIRKAGGIRGLLSGRVTPGISRQASEDSVQGSRELLKHVQGNGSVAMEEKPGLYSTSPSAAGIAFRSSSLR